LANLSGISNESFMGKLLRAPLRLIPPKMVVRVAQGPLRGKKWIVGSSNHGCWLGSYEYEKQKALQRFLKPGDVAYDIGANVGFYSLLASVLVGDTGCVYSFEPLPDNLSQLKKHLELNRIANCTVIDAAVSSFDGEAAFDTSGDRFTGHLAATGALHVRTLTVDQLIEKDGMRPPNLMKLDIEGAEYECLRGAAGVIQEFKPVIFLATHGREVHLACSELLVGWGYRLTSVDMQPPEISDELVALPARR
jgi:FkbM family methyltransferase